MRRHALVGALLALHLALLGAAHGGDGAAGSAAGRARSVTPRIVDDGRVLRVERDGGAAVCRLDLEGWRARVSADFAAAFEEPPRIGDQELRPQQFERFGVASAAPDGSRAVFSVTTYAMATTLSLLGVLHLPGCTLTLVPEAYRGTVEEPAWSPDGRHVAFALGTARAAGEALAVVDTAAPAPRLTLERSDLAEALAASMPAAWAGDDPRSYTPHVRDLSWSTEATLTFGTDPPGHGGVDAPARGPGLRWRTGPAGGLELVD